MVSTAVDASTVDRARDAASGVRDPELPFLTLADLGILRGVTTDDRGVQVTITPTYSGCPAMREITADLRHALDAAGLPAVGIRTVLSPAWTTDWITADGRRKLAEAGIAPPTAGRSTTGPVPLNLGPRPSVPCPQCGSSDTVEQSRFGATACRSLHRCRRCAEPFEHVKEI